MDKKEHAEKLITMYEEMLDGEDKFMTMVLEQAIHALKNGCDPNGVENKVCKLENLWRTPPDSDKFKD